MLLLTSLILVGLGLLTFRTGQQKNPSSGWMGPLAFLLFGLGISCAVASVVRGINPAKSSMRAYHNMHQERQAIQAERLARHIGRLDKPPAQAVYLHNTLAMYSETHFDALKRGSGDAYPVVPCYGGSKGLDPETNISGYEMRASDVAQALRDFPEADMLIFEGAPPNGTLKLKEFRERKPSFAVLSALPNAPFEDWFKVGLAVAASDRNPSERYSAQKNSLPRGGVEKVFGWEFDLHTKP